MTGELVVHTPGVGHLYEVSISGPGGRLSKEKQSAFLLINHIINNKIFVKIWQVLM